MEISDAVRRLERDLRATFGERLRSLVAYAGAPGEREAQPTLALVDRLSADDLRAVADRVGGWHQAGLATPLVLCPDEFARSLDAFPFEFGMILADHVVVAGLNPFEGLRVDPKDLRRACEVQARSHQLHLREGYLETGGRSDRVADLIVRSAPAFAALLASVKRLEPAFAPPRSAGDVERLAAGGSLTSEQARLLFPAYLSAVDDLVRHVDEWSADGR